MKIQNSGFLKNCGYLGVIASVLLVMSLIVAGCTQTTTDNSAQSTAAASPADTSGNSVPAQGAATAAPADAGQPGTGVSPAGTSPTGQHTGGNNGGNFLANETRIAAAAQTLGVSESALTSALTPPAQGRLNITDAATQLSTASGTTITPAQLMAALGMHGGGAGGARNGSYQRNGQPAATNGGNTQSCNTASGQ